METDAKLKPYVTFLKEKLGPHVHHVAKKSGHEFDQIHFQVADLTAPVVSINGKTGEMMWSRGALEALQGKAREPTQEIKAVLAHEIAGHVGHHKNLIGWNKLSVFSAPIIAVTAYELARRYTGTPEDRARKIDEAPEEPTLSAKAMTVAKYLAIGTVGLAAGGYLARHMSRTAEFAADKRAVEFTKNPEALVSALQKLEAQAQKAMKEYEKDAHGITEWLSRQVHNFKNATIHAHPELEERISAIRSISIGK
ncbi:MAG: M48 family metalloprotease [Rickettsiales bacterium]|nr:M48 family metalloprotease [Rickettsiales bacterium]